ncbi:MAG: glycine cleavage system protein T [Gammaproteobacteria bacterium]|nr:glycine cleavage system protein T [Gammaproteobacteria bacterium]
MFEITPTTRLRRSPFFNATVKEGVKGFLPYNQMLMPTGYGDPEGEYWRLINDVALWDVAVERQVEVCGRDAGKLAQILSPRDLSRCVEHQGKYVALCNHHGTIINDPILLKLADDRFWFSIADSNILFWARAIAAERGLSVEIREPDVSPLAVQGPKADAVIADIFGNWTRNLKYFWFREAEIEGIPLMLARSGWSKQGGFELYLMDGAKGDQLWNIIREAGRPYNIGPGNPNMCERIESGLISWGSDTDDETNPFEIRMGKYVDLDVDDDVIGINKLRQIKKQGAKRHQLGLVLEGDQPMPVHSTWYDIYADGCKVGSMTNGVWSYRLKRNIGYALIATEIKVGQMVEVCKDGQMLPAKLCALPFC